MDQADADRREADGPAPFTGTPGRDGPGNAAYQRMQAMLARVQAEEAARHRRN